MIKTSIVWPPSCQVSLSWNIIGLAKYYFRLGSSSAGKGEKASVCSQTGQPQKQKTKTENTFKANGALVGPFFGVIHDVDVKLLPVVIVIKLILFVT